MVESQYWTLGKITAAVCPKCQASALHRSHTTSTLEEKRKQIGHKRPYRCHDCGWRGWLEDAHLRYSAEGMKHKSRAATQQDIDIPNISLEAPFPHSGDEARKNHEASEQGEVSEQGWTQRGAEQGARDTGDDALHREHALKPDTVTKPDERADSQDTLPDFDRHAEAPVSSKESPGFHHRARHKILACPKCGEHALYRSRSRGVGETLRKKMTNRRPYRCHRCGWRGWLSKGF